jgi:hypothetical protein
MVPTGISLRCAGRRHITGFAAALSLAACGGGESGTPPPVTLPGESELAALVRERYTARDALASGAWTWESSTGERYVLLEVQSALAGIVQVRADLWVATDSLLIPVGRSDVMPSGAAIGAFAFADLTADGLPDLLGYVADSADTRFAIFIPGARGAMVDELASLAGWRFALADGDSLPAALGSRRGAACYLKLWAEAPVPDGGAEGWRYLAIESFGRLGPPASTPPPCNETGTVG